RAAASLAGFTMPGFPIPPPKALGQGGIEESAVYSVQVGSFSKPANADGLLARLSQGGYPASIDHSNPRQLRVRVGSFGTHAEAEAMRKRLKKDGYPTKIVP